jgi:hypothetical protein
MKLIYAAALMASLALSTTRADETDEFNRVMRVAYCLPAKINARDATCKSPEVSTVPVVAKSCREESQAAARMTLYVMGAQSSHPPWSSQTTIAMASGAADTKACLEELDGAVPLQCKGIDPLSDAALACFDKVGYAPTCRRTRIRCANIDDALPY